MSYLAIQATAVPSERVFSSSSETVTKHRNRLQPSTIEALQMLKFLYKKSCLDWMKTWKVAEADLELDVAPDVLTNLSSISNKDQYDFLSKVLAEDTSDL